MEPKWISFADAMAETKSRRRHLLLGNGFSISRDERFAYRRLFDVALSHDPALAPLFAGHDADFESAQLVASAADKSRIRNGLIAAIAHVHPVQQYLSAADFESCGRFLEQFAGIARHPHRGRVFTTNYDLFLYWVLVRQQTPLKLFDGFHTSGEWHEGRIDQTFVFYLHGALHHFERNIGNIKPDMEQYKLRWREGFPLPRQVREHIRIDHFPVFVSEGSSADKRSRIRANPYLNKVNTHFAKHLGDADAALFTIGHALGRVDAHITDAMADGHAAIFVGVHTQADSDRAAELSTEWTQDRQRRGLSPLEVRMFKTAECVIWAK